MKIVRAGVNCNSFFQGEVRFDLRSGLSTLPAPKNDYEIVIPEGEEDDDAHDADGDEFVEDAEDAEIRRAEVRGNEGS